MTDETAPPTDETAQVTDGTVHATAEPVHHADAAQADSHATVGGDHGHDGAALGPIDWGKWGFAIVGGVGGLIVLGFFLFALGGLPS